MSAASIGRLTYNLGNDRFRRPVFLVQDGDRWKLRVIGVGEIELSIEQISMIAQVAKA